MRIMIRSILAGLVVPLVAFASVAQGPPGPLTITAARNSPAHASVDPARGGPPYNDLCQDAVVHVLPPDGNVTITGDNTGATDTEDFGNPVSWEAFSTDTCSTVTVSYCGTDPVFALVYSILIVGCPDFIANVQNSGTVFCEDGNVSITYESLPAGTYHVPVLLTAGAQGPYTMTIASDVCDLPPANDICSDAAPVEIVPECSLGLVAGNNGNAVINGVPGCASTASQFQDVWYRFDSGTNTEVVIAITPGTIGDIGLEVREACGGASVFCAVGDTAWNVPVEPGMDYRVRVFSNNDFGFGGTFGICITPPTGSCDAGEVSLVGGATGITACMNGDDAFPVLQGSAYGGTLGLILTNAGDTIVSLLGSNEVDPALLFPGTYHVWGIAYDGDLMGLEAGEPLSGLSATGGCLDLTPGPVEVTIEICQGIPTTGDGKDFVVVNTPDGPCLRWLSEERTVRVDLFDGRGARIASFARMLTRGQTSPLSASGALPAGAYTVRVMSMGHAPASARALVH